MTEQQVQPKYTSNAEVLQLCGLADDDATINATMLTNWILDMEEYINKITGRNFVADGTATARYFDAPKPKEGFSGYVQSNEMYFDECVSVTEVAVDDVVLTPIVDYVLEPYNELPVRKITFINGIQNNTTRKSIRITAKWGYSVSAPRPIQFAAAILAAGIVKSLKPSTNAIKQQKIGDYSVTYEPAMAIGFDKAMETIKEYTKIYV